MRRALGFALLVTVAIACSSRSPKYPACERDEQCSVGGKHDYCVAGKCAYCRTSVDCGDRERCRAGACEPDPDAPPLPEAGLDAGADAEEEAGTDDDESSDERPTPYEVRIRELERRVRQLRRRRP